jgi:hypothetical protein
VAELQAFIDRFENPNDIIKERHAGAVTVAEIKRLCRKYNLCKWELVRYAYNRRYKAKKAVREAQD